MLLTIKFGGTSVGDVERIRSVAEMIKQVRDDGHRVVVVTSAMAGVTNRLIALLDQEAFTSGKESNKVADYFQFTKKLERDHVETARQAIRDP